MGYEASSSLGNNLFICTNFSDECEGDIAIGTPQTCRIDNVLVFCEVTVDTITGLGNTLPPEPGLLNLPTEIAYDPIHERMYVVNTQDNSVSVIDTTTNTVIDTIPAVGSAPQGIAYDPVTSDNVCDQQSF